MKTTLTKVLVTSLLFSVTVLSVIQVTASEREKSNSCCTNDELPGIPQGLIRHSRRTSTDEILQEICTHAREGKPLTFKLGIDDKICLVSICSKQELTSVFTSTEDLPENLILPMYHFSDTGNFLKKESLMQAITEGHSKRQTKFDHECNALTVWAHNGLQTRIPKAVMVLIISCLNPYDIHVKNRILIKQAEPKFND